MNTFKPYSLNSIFSQPQEDKLQTYQEPYAENRITNFVYEEIVLKKLNPFSKINKDKNYDRVYSTNNELKLEFLFDNKNECIEIDVKAEDIYDSE